MRSCLSSSSSRTLLLLVGALVLPACPSSGTPDSGALPDLTAVAPPAPDMLTCPPCSGQEPVCDTSTFYCVACLKELDCGGGGFVCTNKKCIAVCTKSGCGSDMGGCDTDLGLCRGCRDDNECGGATPRCDDPTGRCVPCQLAGDNCPIGQYCSKAAEGQYACLMGCKIDSDCDTLAMGGPATTCCSHKCVDVNTDKANCGTCNKLCGAGMTCAAAICK